MCVWEGKYQTHILSDRDVSLDLNENGENKKKQSDHGHTLLEDETFLVLIFSQTGKNPWQIH